MGTEYRICFASVADAADALRRLPTAVERPDRFDFRTAPDESAWPDASAWIDAHGILFCDHLGGEGRRLLGELVAILAGYGPVTVEEL